MQKHQRWCPLLTEGWDGSKVSSVPERSCGWLWGEGHSQPAALKQGGSLVNKLLCPHAPLDLRPPVTDAHWYHPNRSQKGWEPIDTILWDLFPGAFPGTQVAKPRHCQCQGAIPGPSHMAWPQRKREKTTDKTLFLVTERVGEGPGGAGREHLALLRVTNKQNEATWLAQQGRGGAETQTQSNLTPEPISNCSTRFLISGHPHSHLIPFQFPLYILHAMTKEFTAFRW